jgi:hypothetical protein
VRRATASIHRCARRLDRPALPSALRPALLLLLLLSLAASAAAQSFTVSGVFRYQDKAWNYSGWTGSAPTLPIRRADVTVLDDASGAILGSGHTGVDGSFAVACTAAGPVDVVVRCDADTNLYRLASGWQRIRVTTEGGIEYSVSSPVFPAHPVPLPLDVGAVTALKLTSGSQEANPFNLLDMAVAAMDYVLGPDVGASPSASTIRVYWPGGGGSYASGAGAHIADDDGYDDAVILHELGHVVQNLWSDSDSPGGTHYFGDSDQDPRLSMGEGYATFFNGCVLDSIGREGLYVDANGASQSGGYQLRLRMETVAPYAGDAWGAADEVAVACTLYDLIDDEQTADTSAGSDDDAFVSTTSIDGKNRHRAWWEVFVGPVDGASNLTINDAWDGWFSEHAPDPHEADVHAVFETRRLRFWHDAQEPDGTLALAAPLAAGTWSGDRTLYASTAVPPAPGTGDTDHYAIDLVVGSIVTFETRYPGGAADADTQADTHLDVYRPSGALLAGSDTGGTGRNAAVQDVAIDESGTWYAAVRSQGGYRRYGRYNVRAQYVLENHVPAIVSGPTATPGTILEDESTLLAATAFDPDAGATLVWEWTPLDGGTILGGGQSVTYEPPDVATTTVVSVQLVVSDQHGASAGPALVAVTVEPVAGLCAQPAAVTTIGTGKPGLLGVPTLAGDNLPVVPSSDFKLHASGALPGAPAFLVVGFSLVDAPFDQGTLHPKLDILVPVLVSGSGEVVLTVVVPPLPLYCGLTLHAQLLVPDDPGAAGAKQTAQSNGLSFTFGN